MNGSNFDFLAKTTGSVECLSQTFACGVTQRAYCLKLLAQNLHAIVFPIRQPMLPYANYLS
jgi:hypothetical protein